MGRLVDGWMNGWVGGWIDRWMDGYLYISIVFTNNTQSYIYKLMIIKQLKKYPFFYYFFP